MMMDKQKLYSALRNLADALDLDSGNSSPEELADVRDGAELIRVLARIVKGRSIEQAFGSPGDWGHDTPIGDALASRG